MIDSYVDWKPIFLAQSKSEAFSIKTWLGMTWYILELAQSFVNCFFKTKILRRKSIVIKWTNFKPFDFHSTIYRVNFLSLLLYLCCTLYVFYIVYKLLMYKFLINIVLSRGKKADDNHSLQSVGRHVESMRMWN